MGPCPVDAAGPSHHPLRPMSPDALKAILDRAADADKSGTRYRAREDHELTVHFGDPARAVSVDHVIGIELMDVHVEVEIRDRGMLYAPYEALHAVLDIATRTGRGGGSLGF